MLLTLMTRFYIQACYNPPIISISVDSTPRTKDTAHNIRTTKDYTVSIISEAWIQQANIASINAPVGVSEWPLTGLTKVPSVSDPDSNLPSFSLTHG
jgi:flavin reductase (DIM6/NTAB) family NADH-FMN oxidoreductase RutF